MSALRQAANAYDGYYLPKREYSDKTMAFSDWDILPVGGTATVPVEQVMMQPKALKEVKLHAQHHRRRTLSNCLLVLVCFALLSVVIAGNAAISNNNISNTQLEDEISKLEDEVGKISVSIASKGDVVDVASQAETKLAMGFPEASQVRYLNVEETVEVPREAEAEEPETKKEPIKALIKVQS